MRSFAFFTPPPSSLLTRRLPTRFPATLARRSSSGPFPGRMTDGLFVSEKRICSSRTIHRAFLSLFLSSFLRKRHIISGTRASARGWTSERDFVKFESSRAVAKGKSILYIRIPPKCSRTCLGGDPRRSMLEIYERKSTGIDSYCRPVIWVG